MTSPLITTRDYSQVIGTAAVTVLTSAQAAGLTVYLRILNAAPAGGGTIWLSRSGSPAAVNGAGSFPLYSGQDELWVSPGPVPLNALSAVATMAGTPLTVEAA